jgi:hypothetical protein
MFSRLPADTLGAQAESANEAIAKVVKKHRDERSILCVGSVLVFCFIQELLTVIFTVDQSACLAIYIRHDDLVTFDKLA